MTRKIDGNAEVAELLGKRDLEPLVLLTREAWQERQEGLGGFGAQASLVAQAVLLGL